MTITKIQNRFNAVLFFALVSLLTITLSSSFLNLQARAQVNISNNNSSVTANDIDIKAEEIEISKASERELASQALELEKENSTLETEIVFLERERTELQERAKGLEETINKAQENLNKATPGADTQTLRESLDRATSELDDVNAQLVEVEAVLASHQGKIQANNQALGLIQDRRETLSQQSNDQTVDLWLSIWNQVSRFVFIALLGVVAYLVTRLTRILIHKYTPKEWLKVFLLRLVRTVFYLFLAGIIIYLFAGNIGSIITALGVLSAGLAVALQDYIASVFAWIFVVTKKKYREGDIIKIASTQGNYIGKVIKIELFRTMLEERVGGMETDPNKERPTGKVVSVPNSLLMREPVVNFTHNNKAIMHSMEVEITFSSDHQLTMKFLEKTLDDYFTPEFFRKHSIPQSYKPKVLMAIKSSGVGFSIWFPARIGNFREVMQDISFLILNGFAKKGIDLAYNSLMIYTPDKTTIPGK
jgi:small-conductance mechanosensitive channel